MSRTVLGALAVVLAAVSSGCNDVNTPIAPTPEVPVVTESFSGTVTINGAITHPFVIGTPGVVTARLLEVSTGTDAAIGIALGTWNVSTQACQLIIANDNATQGQVIVGSAQTSGAFCVRLYDVGKFTTATSYAVEVTHR